MSSSVAASQIWYTISAITSGFLGFGIAVAFLVVAFMVRRTRPDCFPLLVTSSSIHLGNLFLSNALSFLLPALIFRPGHTASSGPEDLAQAMFFAHLFTTAISVTGNIIFLAAILRLAKPPVMGNAFAEGRYS